MRAKEERIVLTFKSTTDALTAEKFFHNNRIEGQIIPVPRMISASCGLAWSAPPDQDSRIMKSLEAGCIHVEDRFLLML